MDERSLGDSSKPSPEPGRLRALAAEVVAAVLAGQSLDKVLPAVQLKLKSTPDRALLQALCYGVLRDLRLLEHLLSRLVERPATDGQLQALLLSGLFQLRSTRIPPHAAVSETVSATTHIRQPRARGMVNAVLRRYLRERDALEQSSPKDAAIRLSHPDWLVARLQADWPRNWQVILAANQAPGPMSLRVNARRGTRAEYLGRLREFGPAADIPPHAPQALTLATPVPVEQLPGFAEGDVSVQDVAAQLATGLLDLKPGHRVLDACAAPGGKTAHILESADLELLALDRDAARLRRVQETLMRLGLSAECRVGDASDPAAWWDGRPFDRILLDAPCSGTGVIRRHPDIKWLRRDSDIAAMARTQRRLLDALWPLLAPGGVLLYATCSLLRAEGEAVVADFVRERRAAEPWPMETDWGESCGIGRCIAVGEVGMDGFYYARLRRAH
ncbi:MAG: 16S rRNA (cytosine(967)-C(5))-methyltransferase RsmB [Nevskiales bacterium]